MAGIADRKQIRLEKITTSKDGNGNLVETIALRLNFWAEVSRQGGGRSSLNGQTQLGNSYLFKVNFRPDWKPTGAWRVVYLGKRLTVQSIERQDEERFTWRIIADGKG